MGKLSIDFAEDILDMLPVGIYIFQDGRFVYVNHEICRITGYTREELMDMDPFDLIVHEDERAEMMLNTEKALKGEFQGLPSEVEIKIRCRNEDIRHVSLRPLVVIFRKRIAIITFVRDVTQEVTDREKRRKLEEFIRLTGKMIRHDILNHLSAVSGYLELYSEKKNETHLEKAVESAENCIKTLKRLRELEWLIEEGKEMREISVREVFESIRTGMDVEVQIQGNCCVQADDGIYSIAENLIANAVEHGGSRDVAVTIMKKGKWCEVKVADRGKGIPDEMKSMIFQEGFTCAEKGRGTGLFIVKRLMEKYGGEVWVEDNKPSGSVFVLRFRIA